MLQYTYNDRKVGSAYVYDKELEARLAAGETVGGSEEETEGSSGRKPFLMRQKQRGRRGAGFSRMRVR